MSQALQLGLPAGQRTMVCLPQSSSITHSPLTFSGSLHDQSVSRVRVFAAALVTSVADIAGLVIVCDGNRALLVLRGHR